MITTGNPIVHHQELFHEPEVLSARLLGVSPLSSGLGVPMVILGGGLMGVPLKMLPIELAITAM